MSSSKLDNSLDNIFELLGDFGKYQVFVISLVCIAVTLHVGMHNAFVFTAKDLDYRCEIPGCDTRALSNQFDPDWLEFAVPFTYKKAEKCDMYIPYFNSSQNYSCTKDMFNRHSTVECSSFIYSNMETTIVKDYNLHCNYNLWKLSMVGTVNTAGQFLGLFIAGILSDKYGRKVVLIYGMIASGIFGLIRTLMPSYELFLLFEFLDATFAAGTYICGFVLGIELVRPCKRVFTGTLVSCCYAIGEVFAAGAAWSTYSWKPTIYILYTPAIFLLSYQWLISESIRWNLSKGRIEEAKDTLRKIAEVNGKHLPESILANLNIIHDNESIKSKQLLKDIFKSTILLLRLINCCFCWITCAFVFYGLSLNSVALAGNSYLDFILTSLVEIPAYFACAYSIEVFGRKKSLVVSFFWTGAACIGFIFVPTDSHTIGLCFYLLGKFGATLAFTTVYALASEMFPTPLRHTLMGTCSTFARLGSIISPQTPLLSQIWKPLPLLCFATMSIISGFLSILFPETLNKKLPDTIKEAEDLGKEENCKITLS